MFMVRRQFNVVFALAFRHSRASTAFDWCIACKVNSNRVQSVYLSCVAHCSRLQCGWMWEMALFEPWPNRLKTNCNIYLCIHLLKCHVGRDMAIASSTASRVTKCQAMDMSGYLRFIRKPICYASQTITDRRQLGLTLTRYWLSNTINIGISYFFLLFNSAYSSRANAVCTWFSYEKSLNSHGEFV